MKTEDDGTGLYIGQTVLIECTVLSISDFGDAKLQFMARPNHQEYAATSVNAIFIQRPRFKWALRLLRWLYR